MHIEPKQFKPARNEGKRLNTARSFAELLRSKVSESQERLILQRVKNTPRNRSLSEINFDIRWHLAEFFNFKEKPVLLEDLLQEIFRIKKRPLRVFDSGAGKANLLLDLKRVLSNRRVDIRTTALDLSDLPLEYQKDIIRRLQDSELTEKERLDLEQKFDKSKLDLIINARAETFVPKLPQDFVIDFYGGFTYTQPRFRKDLLMKYAESLTKGGIVLVHFEFVENKFVSKNILDPNIGGRPVIGELTDFVALEKAFEKRGFKAKFFYEQFGQGYYKVNLIIQRVQ